MIYSSVGYCACGQEIWIEFLQKDGRWFARFSDDAHQEITLCPACGRELKEDELDSL